MVDAIAFQTRARTIDHLGREQIADCPTAISELWKNSYDAYSREVALHIYDGSVTIAALVDNGHGMSRAEFVDKWLVVGTESKAAGTPTKDEDRNGLPVRTKQGQKGIGRLSAAALGPLLLIMSKRTDSNYVAALIDWRLFENPFLYLHDIELPVVEFSEKTEIFKNLPKMFDTLMGNVWGNGEKPERDLRVAKAWERYDLLNSNEGRISVRESIENVIINAAFTEKNFEQWAVWNGQSSHGTILLVGEVTFDLEVHLPSKTESADSQAAKQATDRLFQTLSNFSDPFLKKNEIGSDLKFDEFQYSVTAWEGALQRSIISQERSFNYKNLEELEHLVDGRVDEDGVFHGRIKAFGRWLEGEVSLPPKFVVTSRSDTKVGPFQIRLGTFEQNASNSSHPPEIHSRLLEQASKYAGFMVYRNGLRVMPYGREDNDFFEIEKRRGLHAGREFWSYRRLFGRVALTRELNSNLKDKAGREGIIDNKAAKVFRDLVENILMTTARRYFGTDSSVRKELLPEVVAIREKERADDAQKKLRARRKREFRKNLKAYLPKIDLLRNELEEIAENAREDQLPSEEVALMSLRDRIGEIKILRAELSLGTAPGNLGILEDEYKIFRMSYARSNELLSQLNESLSSALSRAKPQSQRELAYSELSRNANYLQNQLRKWGLEGKQLLNSEISRLSEMIDERNKKYHLLTLPLLKDLEDSRMTVNDVLNQLELEKERQSKENFELFDSYISLLRNLEESIDIENLVNVALAESEESRKQMARLNSLAQLGITVEIVGHEIEGFEMSISHGLRQMPEFVKDLEVFKSVKNAHEALSERLRFLSPLKLSGEKNFETITGREIYTYIKNFLGASLESNKIEFLATPSFLEFSIYEMKSRLFPVFINLVNNCIYWVGQCRNNDKKILLDFNNREVIISDNGPGVEVEDIPALFSLFFTRKVRGGRGVGLYLCRANLAAGGHTIAYASLDHEKRLSGANFSIKFSGVTNE